MKATWVAAGLLLLVGARTNVDGCYPSDPVMTAVVIDPMLPGDGTTVTADVSFADHDAGVREFYINSSDLQVGEAFELKDWDSTTVDWTEGTIPVEIRCFNETATDIPFGLGFTVRDVNGGSDSLYHDVICQGTSPVVAGPSDPEIVAPTPFPANQQIFFPLDYTDENGGVTFIHVRNTSCPVNVSCESTSMPMTDNQALVQTFSNARLYLSTLCGNATTQTLHYSYAISLEDSQGHVTNEVPVHFECRGNTVDDPNSTSNIWMYYGGEEGESLLQLDFSLGEPL